MHRVRQRQSGCSLSIPAAIHLMRRLALCASSVHIVRRIRRIFSWQRTRIARPSGDRLLVNKLTKGKKFRINSRDRPLQKGQLGRVIWCRIRSKAINVRTHFQDIVNQGVQSDTMTCDGWLRQRGQLKCIHSRCCNLPESLHHGLHLRRCFVHCSLQCRDGGYILPHNCPEVGDPVSLSLVRLVER